MKTFLQFLAEAEKFSSMFDLESFIQGHPSPATYEEIKLFIDRVPNLPPLFQEGKTFRGTLDNFMIKLDDVDYSVSLDYPQKIMKIYEVPDELGEYLFYKSYSFESLL